MTIEMTTLQPLNKCYYLKWLRLTDVVATLVEVAEMSELSRLSERGETERCQGDGEREREGERGVEERGREWEWG
ncbi:hypothetical protein Tco_0303187 [Tanacetum coccineum]